MAGKPTPLTQAEDRLALCHRIKRHLRPVVEWVRENSAQYGATCTLASLYAAIQATADLKALEETWYAEVQQMKERKHEGDRPRA